MKGPSWGLCRLRRASAKRILLPIRLPKLGVDHERRQRLGGSGSRPPCPATQLRRVAKQGASVDLLNDSRIHCHVRLPVEASVAEGGGDEVAYGSPPARCDHKIVGCVVPGDTLHRFGIFGGITPVDT